MSDLMIKGSVLKYGDDINTDIISPPQYMELPIEEASKYAMSGVDPAFSSRINKGDIIVAGKNFGSGSSRETSPLSLKFLGTGAIVAKFFARIFYRNAINVGIPVIECEYADKISDGDVIAVDIENGMIYNETTSESYPCTKIPEHIMEIINDGGMVENLKKRFKEEEK